MNQQAIEVAPLTCNIGAEIHGVNLDKPLDDQTFQAIHDALMSHQVIFFRNQDITPEQHLAFGRRFGELHVHPVAPSVNDTPELMLIHTDSNSFRNNGDGWHSDVSCDERPPMGAYCTFVRFLREAATHFSRACTRLMTHSRTR